MNAAMCKHFTGVQHDTCKAGFAYEKLANPLPCLGRDGGKGCQSYAQHTPEEIAAWKAEIRLMSERAAKIEAALIPWRARRSLLRRTVTGRIDCPACGTKDGLGFSICGSNGHAIVRCSGCAVAWME